MAAPVVLENEAVSLGETFRPHASHRCAFWARTDGIRRGVIQPPIGAWYDTADPDGGEPLCVRAFDPPGPATA